MIGRKGTGKTYTGMYLELTNEDNVKYLAMDSFDYKAFKRMASTGEGYEKYVTPWQYYLRAKLLININRILKKKEIEEVLYELYGRKPSEQQILNRKLKQKTECINKQLEQKWKEDLAKQDTYFTLSDLNQILQILIEDNVDSKYLLILDGLDEKINENKNYRDIMNGLIWAIKDLNQEMYTNNQDIKVVAFFRKDVFELVQGANTAKIATGSTLGLDWVTDNDDKMKYPLYMFMNLRYNNCLSDYGCSPHLHEIVEILPKNMKIADNTVDSWDWILNFTTYKPRDIVKFLSECGKKCEDKDVIISDTVLWEALPEYSKYFCKELKNELYGFVEEDLIEAMFEQFYLMGKGWKEYSSVQSIIGKSANTVNIVLDNDKLNEIIKKLYEVGILGAQLTNGHEQWYYRKYLSISAHIETSKYKLHPGLWKALSIW